MKKLNFLASVFIFAMLLSCIGIHAQIARKKDNRTVLGFYKLVPNNALSKSKQNSKIVIADEKNGYLKIEESNGRYSVEVALFRKNNGEPLLLVFRENNNIENDSTPNTIKVYEVSEQDVNELDQVTKEVLPRLSSREDLEIFNQKRKKRNKVAEYISVIYKLPRKGRIITVTASNTEDEEDFEADIKLYELHLKNDKFVIVRK